MFFWLEAEKNAANYNNAVEIHNERMVALADFCDANLYAFYENYFGKNSPDENILIDFNQLRNNGG